MKALLLAGGLGTRLRPLTNFLPKPMVPIMGRPLLESTILRLKNQGVDEVVISTCYKSNHIENYFKNGEKLGVKVSFIKEDIPLGTGGAIKNAEEFFNDTFLILNSDIICDIDIRSLVEYHKSKKALATIAMTKVEDPSQYGVIEYDDNDYITAFKEKPKPYETNSKWINAGIYVFEPQLLNEIPKDEVVSIERDTYPKLLSKGYKMAAYRYDGYWIDIGTIEKYKKVHFDILKKYCKYVDVSHHDIKHRKNIIDNSVKIVEPVFIGSNVKIDAKAEIGPYAIIGDNTHIGSNSIIRHSVLWDNVKVKGNVNLINAVVASNSVVDGMRKIEDEVYANGINDYAVS
ncbi:Mannose-1-phosphate guanylyltransferase [Thermoanaerobacterium xylanolyticum LX-11]|uniref:Mannose-1-phosphate guanylyltransferase n=1 Tax=Thermoanaerobacterium xylanolyticum (strain ATCC 49914 / DSM 7097 / LX-11) TaxID=858215 RepID=F6BLE5_THEXL|nr:NDP-sugar synthase [Thermoanaerobacterium xylanolyticum]AEF16121.1 Mannose-1-phosphate guanylyltransferase [Thermoanaerobacterium xylanolyticum LX-11]